MAIRERVQKEVLENRRARVHSAELLSETDFLKRLGITRQQLARLVTSGSIFQIEVDDVPCYPAFLTNRELDQKRLRSICRLIACAPASARVGYLSARLGSLGGISPLESLSPDRNYYRLRKMARAWAAEWSRTWVHVYEGIHLAMPHATASTYDAAAEVDRREPLWKRADLAMHCAGYIHPPYGPYPSASTATVFVSRHDVGSPASVQEAQLAVTLEGSVASARVMFSCDAQHSADYPNPVSVQVGPADSIVEVVARVLAVIAAA